MSQNSQEYELDEEELANEEIFNNAWELADSTNADNVSVNVETQLDIIDLIDDSEDCRLKEAARAGEYLY
jgi:hypothetical protein